MQEQTLGDYRILKTIGVGPLGDVLLAEHRFIKKQYILKVLPAELLQDEGFTERFEEQVAKLALLDHPHIVKIHNVSCIEGVYFLVTDCVLDPAGETTNLAQYMASRKGRLEEEELFTLLKQVASALDYAHINGHIVHSSLKLNNLLIGKGNLGIDISISDFAIAHIISPAKVVARTFKVMAEALSLLPLVEGADEKYAPMPIDGYKLSKLSHSFLQNYAFLAPEQKRFEQVSAAADTYAFGVLIYYLITGTFPEGIFPMPSAIAPEYQGNWDTIITQCLNVDPKLRPKLLLPFLEKQKKISSHREKEVIEELKEDVESFTFIKTSQLRPHSPELIKKEEPVLKPLIHRNVENVELPLVAPALAMITSSAVTIESGKDAISLDYNENYAQQLNAMLNRDPIITQYHPEKKEKGILEPLQTEMSIIQGGEFIRGSNRASRDEMPPHKITLNSFALDIHPVTNEQFLRFLEFMGSEKDQNYHDLMRLKDSRIARAAGRLSIEAGYAKHPVVGVTWYGAVAYAKWAGKRLPTEGEWEIAARGGLEHALYPTGDLIEKTEANFFSSDTTPVMSYIPNAYGLYDMAGNVYEWCQDWYGYNYYETALQEPHNPKGPLQGVYRVLRGGCWKSLDDDLRCSHRHRNNPGTVNSTYGFRCAADVQ